MMDIALLTANANQLKYLIIYNKESQTYYLSFFLIIASLVLQIAVGIAIIFKVSIFCVVLEIFLIEIFFSSITYHIKETNEK